MDHCLYIDLETYSSVNLQKCGVYKYAESPDFEILLFGYAFDDGPVQVIDLTKRRGASDLLPDFLLEALYSPVITKLAYNANFERVCLRSGLKRKIPQPAHDWECIAVMAAELGLPKSLADVGAVIGLPEDKQKLKTGRGLIKTFCVPLKHKAASDNLRLSPEPERIQPEDMPGRWQEFIEYNRMDVETEREVHKNLLKYHVPGSEHTLWAVDQHINDLGVAADTKLAENAIKINTALKTGLMEKAKGLSGLDNPASPAQVKAWIKRRTGVEAGSLRREKLREVKAAAGDKVVSELLDLREKLSKSSIEKYDAILRAVCLDGRLRGLTQFYGANRTGRWAGRLVQLQNLPAGKAFDLDTARRLVLAGDLGTLEMLYDDCTDMLSQLIRSAFIPSEWHAFAVADFNAIEARVLAWLADEAWRLEVFGGGGKIYEASAERMFGLPDGSVSKGDPMRQKGKIAELALGYGGGVGALKAMGALTMGLAEGELPPLVTTWRGANRNIAGFWGSVDAAARRLIIKNEPTAVNKGKPTEITFYRDGPLMRVRLPSGRSLSYVRPIIKGGKIYFQGVLQAKGRSGPASGDHQAAGGWGAIETYGAKLVENIVQAVARDCLAEALLKIEAAGLPIVFHVHDEIICEAPKPGAQSALERMIGLMTEPIGWAAGLPLAAEGFVCGYYRKG